MDSKIVENKTMKIDLHCHTEVSWDCITPIEQVAQKCVESEIKVQAITDHNEVEGAFKLKEYVEKNNLDLSVIIGEEISTSQGEIIGLFLKKKIDPGLSPEKTVAEIKAQNGLVLLPHGFDPFKRFRLKPAARLQIHQDINIVEGFNARASFQKYNKIAIKWAKSNNKILSAGSDAHTLKDVGSAWVTVPYMKITQPEHLLLALKNADPIGIWVHPFLAFGYKLWDFVSRMISTWSDK